MVNESFVQNSSFPPSFLLFLLWVETLLPPPLFSPTPSDLWKHNPSLCNRVTLIGFTHVSRVLQTLLYQTNFHVLHKLLREAMNYILGPCNGAIPPWESQFSSTPSTFLSRFFSFPGDGRKLVSNGSGFSYNVLIAACDSMRPNYTLRQSLNSESFGRGGNKFSRTQHAACHCQQRFTMSRLRTEVKEEEWESYCDRLSRAAHWNCNSQAGHCHVEIVWSEEGWGRRG